MLVVNFLLFILRPKRRPTNFTVVLCPAFDRWLRHTLKMIGSRSQHSTIRYLSFKGFVLNGTVMKRVRGLSLFVKVKVLFLGTLFVFRRVSEDTRDPIWERGKRLKAHL